LNPNPYPNQYMNQPNNENKINQLNNTNIPTSGFNFDNMNMNPPMNQVNINTPTLHLNVE